MVSKSGQECTTSMKYRICSICTAGGKDKYDVRMCLYSICFEFFSSGVSGQDPSRHVNSKLQSCVVSVEELGDVIFPVLIVPKIV